MNSEIFIILVLTHFISDWFFQPAIWGVTKIDNWKTRFLHSIQYSIIFIPVLFFLNINLYWVFYLFITHFVIDSYIPVKLWNKLREIGGKIKTPPWLMIVQDQIIHILLFIPLII